MNLGIMRTKLRRRLGNPDTGDVSNDLLDEVINSAYRDITTRYRFHKIRKLCTFDTVQGTYNYGLPTDCEAVLRARSVTDGYKLRRGGDRENASQVHPDSPEARPTWYYRYRDWVQLDPVPDGVYTIELFYKAAVVDLSGETDVPVIPGAWHEGIVKLARHYFYDERGNVPKAQYALAIYNSWLSTKSIEVDEEKSDIDSGVVIPTLQMGPSQPRRAWDRYNDPD